MLRRYLFAADIFSFIQFYVNWRLVGVSVFISTDQKVKIIFDWDSRNSLPGLLEMRKYRKYKLDSQVFAYTSLCNHNSAAAMAYIPIAHVWCVDD